MFDIEESPEKAILVGIDFGNGQGESLLEELGELVRTAGGEVVAMALQKRNSPDPAHFIGKGKLLEIKELAENNGANLLVFDDELSGAQVRNIEEITGIKVVDRTATILDIFAGRARSKEGRLQVELAQQKYRLPRLIGVGTALSRLGGGIGTRGPGETKLEADRRHIRRRIAFLERELKELAKRRNLQRMTRKRNEVPIVALVGYTNVGKSTLMNKLCGSEVLAENMLFATLDPTARRLILPSGRECVMIDTVGFIRKLPHDLVDAFKSTLEETINADLLLHVADVSSQEVDIQIKVVNSILDELGAEKDNMLLVLNKADKLSEVNVKPDAEMSSLSNLGNIVSNNKTIEVSAVTGSGLSVLFDAIEKELPANQLKLELLVPYSEGWVIPFIHSNGNLLSSDCLPEGIKVIAKMDPVYAAKVKGYVI